MQIWHGHHHFDRISATHWDGPFGTPGRKPIYVDTRSWGSGSDSASGTNPNSPLATITAAMAKCESGKGDYIFVLDGFDNDAVTITVAKTNLHIIGLGSKNHRAPFVWLLVNAGAAPVFTLQGSNAANVEIAGFTMGADASHACIVRGAGGSTELMYAWIHDNAFAASLDAAFVAQDGILLSAGGGDGCLIEHNTFGKQITRDGIRFTNMYGGLIRYNHFETAGKGVHSPSGGAATGFPDVIANKFHGARDVAEGFAITNAGLCGGGFIDDNHASSDFDTSGNNPYLDHDDLNEWGVNWKWDAVQAPATT